MLLHSSVAKGLEMWWPRNTSNIHCDQKIITVNQKIWITSVGTKTIRSVHFHKIVARNHIIVIPMSAPLIVGLIILCHIAKSEHGYD